MQVDINKKNEAPYAAIASIITPLFNNLPQNCTDYVLNANGKAFEYLSTGETKESRFVLKKDDVYSLAYLLAGFQRENISENYPGVSSPIYSPRKARIEIVLPPATENPILAIRFYTLNNVSLFALLQNDMFDDRMYKTLKHLVEMRYNIIISGATGSGKTTLLGALINEIPQSERLVIIEDLPEIDCTHPNFTRLITTTGNGFDGTAAIVRTLRLRPDRIIYGEVRTEAAFDLLDSWNTGHSGGLGTVHASSANEAIERLSKLSSRKTSTISFDIAKDITTSAVDVVIQLENNNGKRCIKELKKFHEKG